MVGSLGSVGGRKQQMLAELARANLANPARAATKGMTYAGSKKALGPDALKPATDDRHKVMEKWVQAALNVVLGVNLKLDGTLKSDARAALMRFQKEEGLPAHGFLDERTLMALELRVGIRAPRDGTHEGTQSRVSQQDPPRAPQKPAPPPEKPGQKALAGDAGKEAQTPVAEKETPNAAAKDKLARVAEVEAVRPKHDPAAALQDAKAKAATGMLQREAMQAVVQVALDREFAREQMTRLGRKGDAALQAEMAAWLQKAVADTPGSAQPGPPWWQKVREMARDHQGEAVRLIREAWLAESKN